MLTLGSGSAVGGLNAKSTFELVSSITWTLGSGCCVGEVKIGSPFGVLAPSEAMRGTSTDCIFSLLLMFERALINITAATTTITIKAPITMAAIPVSLIAGGSVIAGAVVIVATAVVVVAVVVRVVVVAVVVVVEVGVMVFVVLVVTAVVVVDVHGVDAIDPAEPVNIFTLLALEYTHEAPQSIWSKDVASWNISTMLATADTSHADRSWLKERAPLNIMDML